MLATEGPYVVRIVVAAVISWQLCLWLGADQPPVYAVIVPLVALRDAPYSALNVSTARLVGVVGGVCVGFGVLQFMRPSTLAVAVVLAIALLFGMALRVGGTFNIQVGASALLVFANADPDSYALTRLWETAVGVIVTVVLAPVLLPRNPYRAYIRSRDAVARELADELGAGARLAGTDDRDAMRALVARTVATETAARALPADLAAARRAIRIHPRWRRRYADTFAEQLLDLVDRADLRVFWDASGPVARSIVAPLAVPSRSL